MLYEFYLRHFKHRELLEEKARVEAEAEAMRLQKEASKRRSFADSVEQFRYRESPLFQVFYITVVGWTVSVMVTAAVGIVRSHRQGWRTSSIMEPVVKPFLKSVFISPFFSFAAGLAFVNFNDRPATGTDSEKNSEMK